MDSIMTAPSPLSGVMIILLYKKAPTVTYMAPQAKNSL